MDDSDSEQLDKLSHCLQRVREGSYDAIGELYDRYFARSVRLAQSRLADGEARMIDEEVAAKSALDSLVGRMRGGAYGDVNDHLQLWRLLARIVDRKVIKYRRRMYGPTRSPRRPILPVQQCDESSSDNDHVPVASRAPSPISGLIADESLAMILGHLGDPETRAVLLLRLEGFNDIEIAHSLGHSRRWVYRRGQSIKRVAESLLKDE